MVGPLIWLGYKYFCRDLELACDAAVLKELEPEERREYARTGGDGGRAEPVEHAIVLRGVR